MLDLSQIEKLYAEMSKKHDLARQNLSRSLTFSEKILFGHLINLDKVPKRGKSYVELQPDRVAMQDATAQMALLQFALTGRSEAAVPSTGYFCQLRDNQSRMFMPIVGATTLISLFVIKRGKGQF